MRALLDINVIVAMMDPQHIFHDRAHEAWENLQKEGFATCPLTENGTLRILSNESYPGSENYGIIDIIERIKMLNGISDHEFWPDDISILDQ